ncbi:reticulon-4 receptor-like 2a [Polyodon spathula]|uniref:reticulon-4 receptor-like 2a n=1 Tax=Polyodon spathula TaxID=7913 RepID=UPI001B7EE3F3|nr:reticulon-4 receptor-like 2a [Polyodon spathula]
MDSRSMFRSGSSAQTFRGSLWLLLWVSSLSPVSSCPRLCMCYPSPMTVSCQSQNFSAVPAGIPFHSQRIFLQNNRITEVRAESFGFGTQVLWLHSNNISSIEPGAFSDLHDLEELDLGDNPSLRTLDQDTFRGLDKQDNPTRRGQAADCLHMDRCFQLGTPRRDTHRGLNAPFPLPLSQDDLFADLVNLTHLFLHGNLIRVLSENVFRGLVNLDRLLLHQNRIRQVHRRAFRDLGRLTILFLFNNSLSELPGPPLSSLRSLEFLRLNGNPWSCSCQARPLWEWFRKVRVSSSELLCAGPQERKGLDLRFLREIDFARCPLQDAPSKTGAFSSKWWFPKSGKSGQAEKFKGLFGRKGQQTSSLDNTAAGGKAKSYGPEPESALPKPGPQDYWENYENEDSSWRCSDSDCPGEKVEEEERSRGERNRPRFTLLSFSLSLSLMLALLSARSI